MNKEQLINMKDKKEYTGINFDNTKKRWVVEKNGTKYGRYKTEEEAIQKLKSIDVPSHCLERWVEYYFASR
jgi:hypothetical protein